MKNSPHMKKDYLGNLHKTAVKMVLDPTEPDQKTVKTREAEVRDVQPRELYSFATRGGKHEVQRGEFYINVKMGKILSWGQTRGKPADTQIYLEATCLQDLGWRPIWSNSII